MANITVENSESLSELVIAGELDIYCVSDVHTNFLRDFSAENQVNIDLGKIDNFDCAGIQLLIAFFKSLKEKRINYQIIAVSESVKKLAQQLSVTSWFIEQNI